jgi:hypothetical protein
MDGDLKKLKQDLDAQIRRMGNLDDNSRKKLDRLVDYVEKKLQQPKDATHHDRLIEHLENSIRYFEITHPDLTTVMNDMLMMLGNLGI